MRIVTDLLPFILNEIGEFRLHKSLILYPTVTNDGQYLCLEYEPWSLDVFARTRDQLQNELEEQLSMLWKEYALEQDAVLCESAQQLKRQLLSDITHVNQS